MGDMNPPTDRRPTELPPINSQNAPQPATYTNPGPTRPVQQNPLPPIQGQPQQAILIQQPQTNNKNEKYKSSCSKGLGATQIVIGILCIIFEVAAICVGAHVAFISAGIWCGLYFILCGAFGIAAGKHKTTCLIVTHMILCIIAAGIFIFFVVGVAGAGLGHDVNYWEYHWGGDYDDYPSSNCHWDYPYHTENKTNYTSVYTCCEYDVNGTYVCKPQPDGPIYADVMPYYGDYEYNTEAIAMNGVLVFLAVVELIIAICASVLGCANFCCNQPQNARNQVAAIQIPAHLLPVAGSSQNAAPQILIISNGQALPIGQISSQYPGAAFIVQQPQGGTNIPVVSGNAAQPPEYGKNSPPPEYSAN